MNKRKTIIAPDSAKATIMKYLLKEDDTLMMGVRIVPLNVFKNDLVAYLGSAEAEFTRLFKQVQQEIAKDNVYYKTLQFPAFFAYFYDFINDLVRHSIDIDGLPEGDKKEILKWLYDQPLISKQVNRAFNALTDASDVLIYDCFYNNEQDISDLDHLRSLGARDLKIDQETNKEVKVRHAKNNSQEIAGIAQYLIKNYNGHLNDVILMVNDLESNYQLVHQTLSLYDIPHSVLGDPLSDSVRQFVSVLNLLNERNIDNFVNAYNSGAFYYNDAVLVEYISHFEMSYEQLMEPLAYVSNWKNDKGLCHETIYKKMLSNEKRCEKMMAEIREKINDLPFDGDIREKTAAAFSLVSSVTGKDNYSEIDCLEQIRSLCLNVVPLLDDSEISYEVLSYFLGKIDKRTAIRYDEALQISDVYRDVCDKQLAIVIGCTQDSFPKTINMTGFFDEQYLSQIEDYPSLKDRDAFFNERLKDLFDKIPKLIFSYPTNDLEGHKLYKSVYLDQFKTADKAWELDEVNKYHSKDTSLKPETAKKLYSANEEYLETLKKNYKDAYHNDLKLPDKDTIVMSASSTQSYAGCHFKYFLDKGLRLKAEEWFDIDVSTTGNIMHKALEDHYGNKKSEKIEKPVRESFDSLRELFVNRQEYIDLVEARLLANLDHKVRFMDEAIQTAAWKPTGYEFPVVHPLEFDDRCVIINGSIDRLDVDEENKEFMIVDYKSSKKEIKQQEICNGKNIQLLTYLLAYADENKDEKPFGMSYYNLRPADVDLTASDLKVEKELGAVAFEKLMQEKRTKEDRYSTYALEGNYTADEHYKLNGFQPNKDHYEEVIRTIFAELSKSILDGDITIDPHNDACKFCKYKGICHSYVKESAPARPIYVDPDNREEASDENA